MVFAGSNKMAQIKNAAHRDSTFWNGETSLVRTMIDAAIAAANPAAAVREQLEREPLAGERIVVISVGKAAVAMAQGATATLGERIIAGIVTSKATSAQLPEPLQYFQGSHPIPDERSITATAAVEQLLREVSVRDHILCLISGGASALLTAPLVSLTRWREINDALLRCGCAINEVNHVRQHLDRVKGGGLLNWIAPTPCTTLILSDVIGNNIAHIGSGPTVPTERDVEQFWDIFEQYDVARFLSAETLTTIQSTLTQSHPTPHVPRPTYHIIGDVKKSAEAAAQVAREHGYTATVISTVLTGEASEVGARLAREARALPAGSVHVYGGETTVTLNARANGMGGRNQELALAAAIELVGASDVWLATLATDGEDGPNTGAGAIVHSGTVELARKRHLDATTYLANHDSFTFFERLGTGHLRIGATGTNVNDLTILLHTLPATYRQA
jgi:hydroxypyruvate reductase